MALQLFTDPSEGGRAYARGIEKAFDSIGDAAGGILQSYNDARVQKEAALNMLAASDIDGFKKQKEYLVQQNSKDKEQVLLGHYERKYETLASMQGALKGYAIENEKQNRILDLEIKTNQKNATALQVRQGEQKLNEVNAARQAMQKMGASNEGFVFSGNTIEDQKSVVADIEKAQMFADRFPDLPESEGLKAKINSVKNSPKYQTHIHLMKVGHDTFINTFEGNKNYNKFFAKAINDGNIDPINEEELMRESYEGRVSTETLKSRAGNYAKNLTQLTTGIAAPGNLLNFIGVPTLDKLASEGRAPDAKEIDKFEKFVAKYKAEDTSLYENITDAPTVMSLSRMHEKTISENDEDAFLSLIEAGTGVQDIINMISDDPTERPVYYGREMSVEDTGRVATGSSKLWKFVANKENFTLAAFDTRVKTMVNAVGRGLFGEVGVMTDEDAARYRSMLADVSNPKELNLILSDMMMDVVRKKTDAMVKVLAKAGKNVSGFLPEYAKLQPSIPSGDLLKNLRDGTALPGRRYDHKKADGTTTSGIVTNPTAMIAALSNAKKSIAPPAPLESVSKENKLIPVTGHHPVTGRLLNPTNQLAPIPSLMKTNTNRNNLFLNRY